MQFRSRPYLSTTPVTTWKSAALAMLLSVAATPALAAAATPPDASAATTSFADGMTAPAPDTVEIRRLSERVGGLEQKVGQLDATEPQPAPTAAELKRAKGEDERQAEFQRQVWTMP